ncbi:MAG: tol-pal system protein YbgF [Deltaproteobacteria bacterium]|nr:tol-pal system protein YbgF [Deltaproteobacteria bacterium]
MIKKAFIQWVVGFCCLILLTACVTDEQFLYLNDQLVTLNKRVDGLEQETEKKFSGKLNAELGTVRERQANNVAEINELRSEVRRLSGQVEENNHWIKRSVDRDTAERDDLEKRISELKIQIAALEAKVDQFYAHLGLKPPAVQEVAATEQDSPPEKKPAPLEPVQEQPDVSPEQRLYDVNQGLFKNGEYESAISGFKNFLDKYPKSALADNAQFWIGECYMNLGQYEQAILAYQQVIKKYPKGNKVANALLRQAKAFYEINDRTSSKLLLKKLIRKYPKSKEAAVAKKRLAEMK